MDGWTNETVRAMVRYIADDAKIARHVGCTVEEVRRQRRQMPAGQTGREGGRRPAAEKVKVGAAQAWERDARRGSEQLAEALARFRPDPIQPSAD